MPKVTFTNLSDGRPVGRLAWVGFLSLLLLLPPGSLAPTGLSIAPALADDDGGDDGGGDDGGDDGGGDDGGDDGDDGGDDGDDGGGGRSGGVAAGGRGERSTGSSFGDGGDLFRSLFKQRPNRQKARDGRPRRTEAGRARAAPAQQPARAAAARPERAERQLVASGMTAETIAALEEQGFVVLSRQELAGGGTVVKLLAPARSSPEAARQLVRQAAPGAAVDHNHFYRPGEGEPGCSGRNCANLSLVAWPLATAHGPSCGAGLTLGLIDTAVKPDHTAFAEGQIETVRLGDADLPLSGRQHGTAVAALLVGSAESSTPGLLPRAKLIAVDAFHRGEGEDDRAEAFDLVHALDLLGRRGVGVVNMSLSGSPNAVLEQAVARAAAAGVTVVAAAGNNGPSARPVYPAAYWQAVAVTAVDGNKRVYRRAGQGEHIDFAAPGVEIWTAASVKGARPKTGTSFATPFVSAAAALAMDAGGNIEERLARSAEDLGAAGKDSVFGWGLVNAGDLCESNGDQDAAAAPVSRISPVRDP